jgi:hypothetical protein
MKVKKSRIKKLVRQIMLDEGYVVPMMHVKFNTSVFAKEASIEDENINLKRKKVRKNNLKK